MINKITIVSLFLLFSIASIAQNTYFVKSRAILIGAIEDTGFTAISNNVICSMANVSDKIIITFPANSFKTNKPKKDSLLNSLFKHEIKIEFNAESIFDIENDILNSTFIKTVGVLEIDNETYEEPIEYKIGLSPFTNTQDGMNNSNRNGLKLTLKCDFILEKYFRNTEDKEIFSPILEIEVIQATINKFN